jgi:FKBP-type peptidyl-prolyl cis-trans isomerase
MKRLIGMLVLAVAALLTACGPKETAPVAPEPDEDAIRREKWFGDAAKAPDITWRSSGLGIRILAPGTGTPPLPTDTVRVHYTGRLKDGRVFDDSHARGKPSDFVVNRLIVGWAVAMPALKPGGRAQFFIPPVLGYGNMQAGDIPGNSGLIFEVELIAVNPEPAPRR